MDRLRYLFPLLAFCVWRIFGAHTGAFQMHSGLHWRQGILLLEIVILFAGGIYPAGNIIWRRQCWYLLPAQWSADVPQGKRLFLCEHDVALAICRSFLAAFSMYLGQETGTIVKTVALLFRNHSFFFAIGAGIRQSVHALQHSHDLKCRWDVF